MAASFEESTLHLAVFEARAAGMTVRETADALRAPKSTVDRHWREAHRCGRVVPTWGSVLAWRDAHSAGWAHEPSELSDDWVPYEWLDEAGQRRVTARSRGVLGLAGGDGA